MYAIICRVYIVIDMLLIKVLDNAVVHYNCQKISVTIYLANFTSSPYATPLLHLRNKRSGLDNRKLHSITHDPYSTTRVASRWSGGSIGIYVRPTMEPPPERGLASTRRFETGQNEYGTSKRLCRAIRLQRR